jgi:hypothetical protein
MRSSSAARMRCVVFCNIPHWTRPTAPLKLAAASRCASLKRMYDLPSEANVEG